VIHRDVKPGNLLRAEDGVLKLADFGIAKAVSEESAITQVGSVIGTAAYLAPEQAAGERVGPPADIYALGVVAYQFLAGRLPYEAQSLTELALKQQRETPPPLDDVNPEVPRPLAVAVDRALALDVRERFPDAESFREALASGARGVGPTEMTRALPATEATRALRRSTEAPSAARPTASPRQARAPRPPRRAPATGPATPPPAQRAGRQAPAARRRGRLRRTLGTLVVLLLLGAGAVAAVVATSNSSDAVRLRQVVYDRVDRAVEEMQQLIDENAR
jgi:hypothetical protein